jgi:hypothetical protein
MTSIGTTPEIQYISRNSKYYHEKVKANEQKRNEEKERIRAYNKDKYQNDEVYKQYKREQALKNYYKKKNVAAVLQTV